MAYRIKKGDLVLRLNLELRFTPTEPALVIKGPYMATFSDSKSNISSETLAVDIIEQGKVFTKIRCDLLKKLDDIDTIKK